jgi:hypothetical protein
MSWTMEVGVLVGSAVVMAVVAWAWVTRGRKVQQDYGTISPQWINEQRLNDRQSRDR